MIENSVRLVSSESLFDLAAPGRRDHVEAHAADAAVADCPSRSKAMPSGWPPIWAKISQRLWSGAKKRMMSPWRLPQYRFSSLVEDDRLPGH